MPVPARIDPLWWHKQGLSYTKSGYGYRIPTQYRVFFKGRDRRVYACCFSNASTLYIGKSLADGIIVHEIE